MKSPGDAVVIGAGIVGVASALYLQRDGWQVTIVDREPAGRAGASYGNGGLIATHFVHPVALRGILARVPGMLLDQTAPLAIRWRYLPILLPWLVRLLKATDPGAVERATAAMASLFRFADEAYAPLIEESDAADLITRSGAVIAHRDRAGLEAAAPALDLQRRHGVAFDIIDDAALRRMSPALSRDYRIGVHYPGASLALDPYALVCRMARRFEAGGGRWHRAHAVGFRATGGRIAAVETEGGAVPAAMVVLCAGAWSKPLARQLGARVPLDTERGYHLTFEEPGIDCAVPTLVGDLRFGMTRASPGVRVTGTVEFGGLRAPPNPRRFATMLEQTRQCFPGIRTDRFTEWMGHRPSLPDSLPVIGRAPGFANALLAFGHGHLGLTGAAITGRAIADLAAGRAPPLDLHAFRAGRF